MVTQTAIRASYKGKFKKRELDGISTYLQLLYLDAFSSQ